jgi:hypothetical protein
MSLRKRADVMLHFLQSLRIRSRELQIIPLRLNHAQSSIWQAIEDRLNNKKKVWLITLKARREGVSTLFEALMLTRTILDDYVHSLVMASNTKNTAEIWNMARTMVDNSPWHKYVEAKNKELHIGKSKLIVATAGTADTTRGFDLTCLHLSELAYWENPNTMVAALQCLPDYLDTFCFIESTANGKVGRGEQFYDMWCRAASGDSEFIPIFLPWFAMPEYHRPGYVYKERYKAHASTPQLVLEDLDAEEVELKKAFQLDAGQLAWRRWAISNKCEGSLDTFNAEYPSTPDSAFVASGNPMFRNADLIPFQRDVRRGESFHIEGSRFVFDPQGYVEVWKHPEAGHTYVIGADTSMGYDEGTGRAQRSRSSACVLDMTTLEQCAEYDASTPPHMQARHLAALGNKYNNALLAPEVTASGGGGGRELIVYLKELNYWNIHVWRHADRIRREQGSIYGWETNSRTRPMMIARIREVINERTTTIHSAALLKQLANFGENEAGRTEALSGHDDLLFAFGIALCSRRENYFPATNVVPITQNKFDPSSFGFPMHAYAANEAVARHWQMLQKKAKRLPEKDWLAL